ncbi:GNAT family N-acetyltransferase [Herbaspirillum sp. RTI4]|uniref:GNAT family N-acetyltransferase n=1 Tax=Herbaspirillum sp. RTI4 TaxID=3048640 RepID=UPI002AB581F1|nr:GNAT family N-acetyltransferase [Herbaspirillum sp. RTI4]MDY7577611.1 GNAT family N-acetyltransferase [Herbaspirillum sp. RTI4]MEA9983282.1 GNAT family N-acetyltransferase [Herbaspirillum sp. RTI4]
MEIELHKSSISRLDDYIEFYKLCFPQASNLHHHYFMWLYLQNPEGQALGADAICEGRVVGQVIAIPGTYHLHGKLVKGLIAVNVAVHPSFQGRHLFKRLGLKMCEFAAEEGFEFVIGVANAAATPGWVRQMGFQLVGPLEARIGMGTPDLGNRDFNSHNIDMMHAWTPTSLTWRASNPLNSISFRRSDREHGAFAFASAGKRAITSVAILPESDFAREMPPYANFIQRSCPKVFLGLIPGYRFGLNFPKIPLRFKPSPLNLIYKNLRNKNQKIDVKNSFINFLDFDAF